MVSQKTLKIIHWSPRVISILAILTISMFALDAFEPELTVWQQIVGFAMHLVPSFILLIFLIIAWKWELVGGILFTLVGAVLSPFVFKMNYNMNQSVSMSIGIIAAITFPFIVVGVLFIISHYLKKKQHLPQ